MKLEEQVCSIKLAQILKGLGVNQESLFYWRYSTDGSKPSHELNQQGRHPDNEYASCAAAFTVAELGEMLPSWGQYYDSSESLYWKMPWKVRDSNGVKWYSEADAKGSETEADARAKMLIHLIETKTIAVTKSNQTI
jgi:hypothetical protein